MWVFEIVFNAIVEGIGWLVYDIRTGGRANREDKRRLKRQAKRKR